VLALALLLVVAGAVAVPLSRGEAPPPTPSPRQAVVAPPVSLQAGRVKVELPSTWRPLSLPIDVPGLPRDGAAAPNGQESGGVVLVGMAPKDAHRRALLSPRLGESTPEAVTLGRLDAYRHAGLSWNGRALTVYAVPTSKGVATVACLAPVQPGDCRRIAESLVVDGATAFPLGPDPRFAKTTALKLPSRSLQARTAAGQAKAARRVAADYRSAHGRLARVKAGPADEPLVRSLRHRLTAAADAFQALARAADSNDRGAYAKAAKRARAAESGLRHTVRASVYRGTLEPPRAHAIPALRRPPTVVTRQAPHTEQPEQTKPSPQQPQRPGPSKPQPPRCTGTACGGKPAPKPTNPDFGGGEG
jgi:hypothetical protein